MKVLCESCGTRYAIPDEKVRGAGRVFRINCRKCGEAILVHGVDASAGGEESTWYYVVGADRLGPVGEGELRRLVEQGDVGSGTYVWRAGMSGWAHLGDVDELRVRVLGNGQGAGEVAASAEEPDAPAGDEAGTPTAGPGAGEPSAQPVETAAGGAGAAGAASAEAPAESEPAPASPPSGDDLFASLEPGAESQAPPDLGAYQRHESSVLFSLDELGAEEQPTEEPPSDDSVVTESSGLIDIRAVAKQSSSDPGDDEGETPFGDGGSALLTPSESGTAAVSVPIVKRRRKHWVWAVPVAIVLLAGAAGGAWWFATGPASGGVARADRAPGSGGGPRAGRAGGGGGAGAGASAGEGGTASAGAAAAGADAKGGAGGPDAGAAGGTGADAAAADGAGAKADARAGVEAGGGGGEGSVASDEAGSDEGSPDEGGDRDEAEPERRAEQQDEKAERQRAQRRREADEDRGGGSAGDEAGEGSKEKVVAEADPPDRGGGGSAEPSGGGGAEESSGGGGSAEPSGGGGSGESSGGGGSGESSGGGGSGGDGDDEDVNNLLNELNEKRKGGDEDEGGDRKDLPEKLSAAKLQGTLRDRRDAFSSCYDRMDDKPSGNVTVRTALVVENDGSVRSARIVDGGGVSAGVQSCLVKALKKTDFPKFQKERQTLRYPIVLH